MKKIVLTLFFMLFSFNVMADWTFITSSIDNDEFYLDFSTLKNNGNIKKIWMRKVYGSVSSYGDWSSKTLTEFDCNNDVFRFVYYVYYTDKESMNISTTSSLSNNWYPLIPDSVISSVQKKVCGK